MKGDVKGKTSPNLADKDFPDSQPRVVGMRDIRRLLIRPCNGGAKERQIAIVAFH
jgi:hypothetical protein